MKEIVINYLKALIKSIIILSIITVPSYVIFYTSFSIYLTNLTRFIVFFIMVQVMVLHYYLANYLFDKENFRKNIKKEFVIFEIFSIILSICLVGIYNLWS